jgi:hypothetical protein
MLVYCLHSIGTNTPLLFTLVYVCILMNCSAMVEPGFFGQQLDSGVKRAPATRDIALRLQREVQGGRQVQLLTVQQTFSIRTERCPALL